MLRPATPLSVLLFISFVLLLISTISTPIVSGIPLASYQGVNFGVFGWCNNKGQCSKIQVGWNTDEALPNARDGDFNLPSSARHSLSSLLIVHPVAALCNLIVLGLAVAAHLHSPSHSARYLLGLLILLLPTLLITLLAFLVDILLFVPHLQWGGWIVLASTILITASGVVTCAMRRTLVSRKARKKRIAENAEMSGANFYARQAEESKMIPMHSTESKAPIVNGAPGADSLPSFATYAARRSEDRPMNGLSPTDPMSATSPVDDGRFYRGQRSRSNSRPRQDEFGAPLVAGRSYEDRPPMPMQNRGGYGPPRGRGAYPPRGAVSSRGSVHSRGLPPSPYAPGRGGYPGRGRGGYASAPPNKPPGVIIPAGMSRKPPPGYGPQSPDGMQAPYGPSSGVPYQRSGDPAYEPVSPSNYGSDPDYAFGPAYTAQDRHPAHRRQSPYGSRTQSPSGAYPQHSVPPAMPPPPDQSQYGPAGHQRPVVSMDSDVLGMVEMQRAHPQSRQSPPSSPQEYVPVRAGWSNQSGSQPTSPVRRKRLDSGGSDYVEDVDPKFATQASAPPAEVFDQHHAQQQQLPPLLMAGRNPNDPSPESSNSQINTQAHRSSSYEDLHPGARSPVESETSNFTSVSQRPMNPNWQPGHGGEFNSFGPQGGDRRQQQRKQDMLFAGNPDFEIPGMGVRNRGGYRGGRSMYGGAGRGAMRPPPPSVLENMGGDGRYPASMPPPQQGGNGAIMREI